MAQGSSLRICARGATVRWFIFEVTTDISMYLYVLRLVPQTQTYALDRSMFIYLYMHPFSFLFTSIRTYSVSLHLRSILVFYSYYISIFDILIGGKAAG